MKKFESWLFPVAAVVAVLVILIAVNVLGGFLKVRGDLTENKLYTLSPGTKKILDKLDTPVEIRFYYSRDNTSMPVPLRTYAQEIEDLLSEYQQASHGKIQVVKLDPKPDSDAEDSARLDGVQGQTIANNLTGDKIYLGLAVSCLDAKTQISFLSPERETLLEYDISRAVSSVVNPKKGGHRGNECFAGARPGSYADDDDATSARNRSLGFYSRVKSRTIRCGKYRSQRKKSTTTSPCFWWRIRKGLLSPPNSRLINSCFEVARWSRCWTHSRLSTRS